MNKYKNLVFLMQIGINMALPILAGVFIGKWLDDFFGTSPIILLVCIVIFALSSFLSLFRMVSTAFKIDNRREKDADKG
ncbi:MAG: ATP synthase subunit [Clostridiales bacterium]|nr:MAG: ATP synthase subunit [Clostridiales bacterium]